MASSSPQIEENLALALALALVLVLALAGKYDAAEKIAKGVLPKDKAEANMVYLRTLTAKGG